MPQVSCGTNIDTDIDEDAHVPEATFQDRLYGASIINEAILRIDHTDQLSNYERRVALREMKECIRQALDDVQTPPGSPDVARYLAIGEAEEAPRQLATLRDEMHRLEALASDRRKQLEQQCADLRRLWEQNSYAPGDLLEVRIRSSPQRLPLTQQMLGTVASLLEVWQRYSAARRRAEQAEHDAGAAERTYAAVLTRAAVPETLIPVVLREVAPGGPAVEARQARLACALEPLASIHEQIKQLGAAPRAPRTALEHDQFETWIAAAQQLRQRCAVWELAAGIPVYDAPAPREPAAAQPPRCAAETPVIERLDATLSAMTAAPTDH